MRKEQKKSGTNANHTALQPDGCASRATPILTHRRAVVTLSVVSTEQGSGALGSLAAPEGYRMNPIYIETKSKRAQLLLQPSVHEAIRQLAEDEGTSFNDYVNTLLREHAESRGAI